MTRRTAKDALYDGFAAVAKALSSGRRAEIVDLLAQTERPVEEIATEIEQSVANTSHHLQVLSRAGLVASRRSGTQVFYRLSSDRVAELLGAVREVSAEQIAQIASLAREYIGDRDELEPITREELASRLRRGAVTVIDVRPAREFEAGHIAGARCVPPDQLKKRLREISGDREIVAYCRGPYCAFADDAVRLLARQGKKARRLEDGFPEWRRAGFPMAVGQEGRHD